MNAPVRVPILVYHHVYPEGAPELDPAADGAGILGEAEFRRQMRYLADEGWTVVSTSSIADWLAGAAELPARCAALHFDNGWLDTLEVAFPLLQELGMTATCFPITDGVEAASRGGSAAVRTLTEGVVEKPFMTWADLRRLLAAGWEIGGHTATHCKMAEKIEAEGEAGGRRGGPDLPRADGESPRAGARPLRLPQRLAHRRDRPHPGGVLPDPAAVARGVAGALELHRARHLAPGRRLSEHRPADRLR